MNGNLAEYIPQTAEEVAEPPKPFNLWRLSDFEAYVVPPGLDILGDGLIRRGQLALLIGHGGVGKSRLSLAVAVSQIVGRGTFCGLTVHPPARRWLFFGNENSVARLQGDLAKLTAELTEHQRQLVEEHLMFAATFLDSDPELVLDHAAPRITATMKQANPGVVVLDPWADLCPGDENTTVDTRRGIQLLRQCLREGAPEAAMLVIAHAKPGRQAIAEGSDAYSGGAAQRGNKSLYASARAMLNLSPGDADNFTKLVLACGKSNDAPRFAPRGIKFDPQTFTYSIDPDFDVDAWRDDIEGKRSKKTVSISDVCEAVRAGKREVKEIVDELADLGKERTVKQRLREAVSKKYLIRVAKGKYALGPKFDDSAN